MLVWTNQVVIRRIIQEDRFEADGKPGNGGAGLGEFGIWGLGEDEEADREEPAGVHHEDETRLSRWFAADMVAA